MYTIPHSFHYRKKPTGWQVILSYKSGNKWKQKSKQGFAQKNQAKAAGDVLLKELQETYIVEPTNSFFLNITLQEFLPIFLSDKKMALSDNTIMNYYHAMNAFPEIVSMPITELKRQDIQQLINGTSYKRDTLKNYLKCYKALVNHAIKFYEFFIKSPFNGLILPNSDSNKEIKTITNLEFTRLYARLYKEKYLYSVIIAVGYYTGMRYGEILGLQKQNINLDTQEIHVTKQLKRFRINGNDVYKLGKLKTKNSFRTIPFATPLKRILQEYWEYIPELKDDRIFPVFHCNSGQINTEIKKDAPDRTMHSLRHTYATTLLANGVDIKTVAALLGDTVEVVIKTYIDYNTDMRKKAAQKVELIFK